MWSEEVPPFSDPVCLPVWSWPALVHLSVSLVLPPCDSPGGLGTASVPFLSLCRVKHLHSLFNSIFLQHVHGRGSCFGKNNANQAGFWETL